MKHKNIISIPFETHMLSQKKGAYIVGGSTRDLLLDRSPTDYDIAVSQNPELFAKELAEFHQGTLVPLGNSAQRVFRVVTGNLIFDITRLIGDDVYRDMKRRDFTINAMAIEITSGKLIDVVGGRKDLRRNRVRMVSRTVFKDDPVRLLRAYRLAGTFDFDIDQETEMAVQRDCGHIRHCAGERIRSEFVKILSLPSSYPYIRQMADNGLLNSIFPVLESLKSCRQSKYHEYDAYEHTLSAFAQLEKQFAPHQGRQTGIVFFPTEQHPADIPLLKFALLLHDIGKPVCQTTSNNDAIHYYGHEKKGADLFDTIAQRLRLSSRESKFISHLIGHHMRPYQLFKTQQKGQLSKKGITRFFMTHAPQIPHLLLHALADFEGKGTARQDELIAFEGFTKNLMETYRNDFLPKTAAPPLISGHDLITTFGLKPSPLFSKILTHVETARLSDEALDRSTALRLVREMLNGQAQRR